MSKKEGYSRKGLFGEIKHYDANGRKVGESRPISWEDIAITIQMVIKPVRVDLASLEE